MKALVPVSHITEDDYVNSTIIKQKLIEYINDVLQSEGYKTEYPRNQPNEPETTTDGKSKRKPVQKVPMENVDDQVIKSNALLLPILKAWIQASQNVRLALTSGLAFESIVLALHRFENGRKSVLSIGFNCFVGTAFSK